MELLFIEKLKIKGRVKWGLEVRGLVLSMFNIRRLSREFEEVIRFISLDLENRCWLYVYVNLVLME